MKKFFKILLGLICITLVSFYLTFLFVLPNTINLTQYKEQLQDTIKEQTNLDSSVEQLKLVTKPNLQAGIETGNLSIKLPDGSTIFNAEDINLRISLLQLLLLRINVSADIKSPTLYCEIENGKQFKIVSHIENLLNNQKELDNAQTAITEAQTFPTEWIKLFAHANITDYKIIADDIKSGHNLKLVGNNLKLGYLDNKKLTIKTDAKLYSDEEEMIVANADINTFLPEFEPIDEEEDDAIETKLPFINPVLVYRNYNLKANIDTKLKIRQQENTLKTWGYFNVEDITANLSGLQLPKSYIKIKTRDTKIDTDTNLYFAEKQNLKILGTFDYFKPKMNLSFISQKIYFHDVILLAKAVLDTLRIKNDFASLKGNGYFLANADIKTDFKKLKSNGSFKIVDGKIASDKLGLVLDKMNINLILDNNILDIPNSSTYINGKKLSITGKIDEKTNTNIYADLENLPLPELYKAFAPTDLKKSFKILSGNLTLKAVINGKLKDAIANLKLKIEDFSLSDSAKTYIISNESANIELLDNFKAGLISDKNFNIHIPMSQSNISIPLASANFDTKNISIPTALVKINDNSKVLFSGDIQNYLSKPQINFLSNGKLDTKDIRKFAGKDFENFIDAKGILPIEITLNGNNKKQTINAIINANEKNYITPLHINNIKGNETALKTVVDIRNNHIKIKESGLFTQISSIDEEGAQTFTYEPIITINGTIVGDYINKIAISIPENLNGSIYAFKKSYFSVKPSIINVFGDIVSPKIRGLLSIENVNIPDLYIKLNKCNLNFKDTFLNFVLTDLNLNGSDMNIAGDINLTPSNILEISNLDIKSKYMDADKVMKVSDAAAKIMPQSDNAQPADIPATIKSGKIDFKKIKSRDIILTNTSSKIAMKDNIFFLHNLITHMCGGDISGRIAMNLVDGFMKIKVKGKGLDTEKLLLEAAAMKDTLTGTATFETDISLSGTTYEEQVKSLLGKVVFSVKDGQFGPFGRLENMILAENIRESEFFKTTIGRALEPLVTIDTTHFSSLDGELSFKNGITNIESITSSGNILALKLFGEFNLLNNIAKMKVRSRLASDVSDMLGPISVINPINLVKSTPGLNVVLAKSFSLFCETVTPEEMEKIPDFAKKHSDNNSTKFQIILKGDVNKPLTLVKSFKWLATQEDIDKANVFASELQIPQEIPEKPTKNVNFLKRKGNINEEN